MRYALLALFVAYYADIGFFTHSHIVNGVTIVHSHFYKHDNGEKPMHHKHSGKEIQLISTLSQAQTIVDFATPEVPANCAPVIAEMRGQLVEQKHFIPAVQTPSLRAPPLV